MSPHASVSESLGRKHKCLTALQFLFCLLTVFNISICSIPFDDLLRFIKQGAGAKEKPAILPVETAQPRLDLTGLARRQDREPVIYEPVQIVRMNGSRPPPILNLFRGETGIIQPAAG